MKCFGAFTILCLCLLAPSAAKADFNAHMATQDGLQKAIKCSPDSLLAQSKVGTGNGPLFVERNDISLEFLEIRFLYACEIDCFFRSRDFRVPTGLSPPRLIS
jgi:hypothetical protein